MFKNRIPRLYTQYKQKEYEYTDHLQRNHFLHNRLRCATFYPHSHTNDLMMVLCIKNNLLPFFPNKIMNLQRIIAFYQMHFFKAKTSKGMKFCKFKISNWLGLYRKRNHKSNFTLKLIGTENTRLKPQVV